jgi:uncharacterized coiled-coil DUF342 family protein
LYDEINNARERIRSLNADISQKYDILKEMKGHHMERARQSLKTEIDGLKFERQSEYDAIAGWKNDIEEIKADMDRLFQ